MGCGIIILKLFEGIDSWKLNQNYDNYYLRMAYDLRYAFIDLNNIIMRIKDDS